MESHKLSNSGQSCAGTDEGAAELKILVFLGGHEGQDGPKGAELLSSMLPTLGKVMLDLKPVGSM